MPPIAPHYPSLEHFKGQLHRHGLKATRQRLAVHEAMLTLGHASADMVQEALARKGARVTVASVYNILSQLADMRIYARRLSATNKMFFDIVPQRHIHLYDRENHTYRDIVDEELTDWIAAHLKHRKFKGYTIEDLDIQFVARPTRKTRTR